MEGGGGGSWHGGIGRGGEGVREHWMKEGGNGLVVVLALFTLFINPPTPPTPPPHEPPPLLPPPNNTWRKMIH